MAWNDENLAPSVTQETDAALVALGQRGFDYVGDTTAMTGNYAFILTLAATQFANLSALNSSFTPNASNFYALTIPANTTLYGPFTGFTLTSGKVIAYKA
jgi:putative exporter of polyketide antibiotics